MAVIIMQKLRKPHDDVLIPLFLAHSDVEVGRLCGVSPATANRWRHAYGIEARRQGPVPGSGQVGGVILRAMEPGVWYDARALWAVVPQLSRQSFYDKLHRLHLAGRVERRGERQGYEWRVRAEEGGEAHGLE